MTRRTRTIGAYRNSPRYVADGVGHIPAEQKGEDVHAYRVIPTSYPKTRMVTEKDAKGSVQRRAVSSRPVPEGMVDISGIEGPKVRQLTFGYLNQRMPRTNSVETNQNYIRRIMENPRTPECNRRVAYEYVIANPERFLAVDPDFSDSPGYREWAERHNGNCELRFRKRFLERYGRYGE